MRPGLLKTFRLDDDLLQRLYANVNDAVNVLAADHDVIYAPVNSLALTAALQSGKTINWYRGTPDAVLTLPLANALGTNVAAVVIVANASSGAISIKAPQPHTLTVGTSVSLAAGGCAILVSDGISKWANGSGAASSGASETTGVAVLDFGVTPQTDATVAVVGQAAILAASKVQVWFQGDTTADNSEADHILAGQVMGVASGIPTPGVGFTIDASATQWLVTGTFNVRWAWQ